MTKKDFDSYSNYDDRDLKKSSGASKIGKTHKEEFGIEKNFTSNKKKNKTK